MNIKWIGAHENNFTQGRGGNKVEMVVMHWIVGSLSSADATFANPDREASAHYGVEGNTIHQYVEEKNTAWHAGDWSANQRSIGIEHSGGELKDDGTRRVPSNATHETSAKLVAEICRKYNIPIDHSHILPHNKFSNTQCPGSLDIDRIINLAKGEKDDSVTLTDFHEIKSMEVLRDAYESLEFEGEPFGNIEGMTRHLVGFYENPPIKEIEKEVIKEVPVEVEKIVYKHKDKEFTHQLASLLYRLALKVENK